MANIEKLNPYSSINELDAYRIKFFVINTLVASLPSLWFLAITAYQIRPYSSIILVTIICSLCFLLSILPITLGENYYLASTIHTLGVFFGIVFSALFIPFLHNEYLIILPLILTMFGSYPYQNRTLNIVLSIFLALCGFLLFSKEFWFENNENRYQEYDRFNKVFLGVVFYITVVHVFITVAIQKKALQIATKSNSRYMNLFNHMKQGIIIYDLGKDRVIDCNDEALKIYGYPSKDAFNGSASSEFLCERQMNGETKEEFIKNLVPQILINEKHQYLVKGRKYNGDSFIGEKMVLKDFTDQYKNLIFFLTDVTEKYKAEQELQERTAIFKALIDQSFDAIDINEITTANFRDKQFIGRLIVRNQSMIDITRQAESPLVDFNEILAISPAKQKDGIPTIQHLTMQVEQLVKERRLKHEWTLEHPDGKIIELEAATNLVESNGKLFLIRVYKDITEQKKQEMIIFQQIEDLNAKKEELEKYIQSNLHLENFAYLASHDLQAPLRTTISFVQLLEMSAQSKLDVGEKEYLSFIVSSTKNLHSLITDLLLYSRANTSKLKLESIDIEYLLHEIIVDLGAVLEQKSGDIQFFNLPENIIGDRIKIKQLFQNLLINALKFSKPDTKVVVLVKCLELSHYWQFSVEDNGIGIPAEYHDKIFLLFRRLHVSDKYEGTGIGLSICKTIVEQHGGKIWVDTQRTQGTVIQFTMRKNPSELIFQPLINASSSTRDLSTKKSISK